MTDRSDWEVRQEALNAAYNAALARVREHIARGTDYTPNEWQAEVERARVAGAPGNACWAYRTPSPLSKQQVIANDALAGHSKAIGMLLKTLEDATRTACKSGREVTR